VRISGPIDPNRLGVPTTLAGDGVSLTAYNPPLIHPLIQRQILRKRTRLPTPTSTVLAAAGARLNLLGQPERLTVHLQLRRRECC